jgi:hypothetical protein
MGLVKPLSSLRKDLLSFFFWKTKGAGATANDFEVARHLPPPHSASLAPFATRELTFHTLPTPPL